MSDAPSSEPPRSTSWSVSWIVGIVVTLLFLPLVLSGLESLFFHTSHVEDVCRRLGIHGALSAVYKPLFEFITYLFRLFRHR